MNSATLRRLLATIFLVILCLQPGHSQSPSTSDTPLIFPGMDHRIQDPATFFSRARRDHRLLLLKNAVFDPLRDDLAELKRLVPVEPPQHPSSLRSVIVQFHTSITPAIHQRLRDLGADICDYIPNNALLVRLPTTAIEALAGWKSVRWLGNYLPALKISPEIAGRLIQSEDGVWPLAVEFFPGSDIPGVLAELQLESIPGSLSPTPAVTSRVRLMVVPGDRASALITRLANREEVKWIGIRPDNHRLNDNSIWVCQSGDPITKATPVFAHGIIGADQVIAIADSGLDKDHCAFIDTPNGPVLASQMVPPPGSLVTDTTQRKLIAYNVLPGADSGDEPASDYHGTHVSGSAAGDDWHHPASGTDPGHDHGDGMAPLARIIFEDAGNAAGELAGLSNTYPYDGLWLQEAEAGAHISTNSWGVENNQYLLGSSATDRFVWEDEHLLIFVSAGNGGPAEASLNYLATAKNVIGVGATFNGETGAQSMAFYSSKGPTADGRIKPDLSTPGDRITSALGDANQIGNCVFANSYNGFYFSGTSMASPTAAGLAALARQYFTDGWYPDGSPDPANGFAPSAALLKAVLINSCANMIGGNTGNSGKEDAPAMGQGWGRLTLDQALYFADEPDDPQLLVRDVANDDGVSTGGVREYPLHVRSGSALKITLVWTDPPAGTSSAIALVNDLDLELVAPDGTIYRGNQWNGPLSDGQKESQADPDGRDTLNNVEGILILSPVEGDYTLRIIGTDVPGYGTTFTQGYGLAVTGSIEWAPAPILNIRAIHVDDTAGNGDGILDPGETVELTVDIENSGNGPAESVQAVLSTESGDNVTLTGTTADYGTLPGQAHATNSTPFSFSIDAATAATTRLAFTLTISTTSGGDFVRPFTLVVQPGLPPTMANLGITEAGIAVLSGQPYPSYVNIGIQFDYQDPDADLQKAVFFFRVNGRNVTSLPLEIDASALSAPSGTGVINSFPLWNYIATNVGETVQLSGYLEDAQGGRSPIVDSNPLTFQLGSTPSTPMEMDDDDSFYVPFPDGFLFPFYGETYTGCWLNTDGNISFQAGYEYQDRSPGAFLGAMPRIAPLLTDLAKSPGETTISLEATTDQVTFSWNGLPQWSSTSPTGVGSNTFSVSLYPDGAIDLHWDQCTASEWQSDSNGARWKAVVGLSPGGLESGTSTDLSALDDPIPLPGSGPLYQSFSDTDTFDLSTMTLHFVPPQPFAPVQTLIFPRLAFQPGETVEGYGFVNPAADPARVRFTAIGAEGQTEASSALTDWPSGGQAAYQADGLLGLSEATTGWVLAESDQPGLLGFFLSQVYNPGLVAMDGAAVATGTTQHAVLPRVKSSDAYSTDIFLVNPGSSAVTVTITGLDGQSTHDGGSRTIPAGGYIRVSLVDLFGSDRFDGALLLDGDAGFTGNAVIRYDGEAIALSSVNLQPVSGAAATLYAAHIARITDLYFTEINLVNPGPTDATATLSAFAEDGSGLGTPTEVTVPAGQMITLDDSALGLPATGDVQGWLRIDSPDAPLTGCLTFGNPVDTRYESTLPLQAAGGTDIYFAQVASGEVGGVDFFTGLAIVNPHDQSVTVSIEVRASDGSLLGSVTRTLAAGEKYVRLLPLIEGIGELPVIATGYLHITADAPVLSFELFGDSALNFLSAVPAQF